MQKIIITISFLLQFSIFTLGQNPAIINLDSTHQVIRGFGAANILPWRPDMTQDEINTAFGTNEGQLGFSILRLRLPSSVNEFAMNVPTAQAAHEMGVTLIASPWSPPASMKTNNNTVGGELKENSYSDYAAHLKSFADYMNDNNAPIYAISVQNEPDVTVTYESCDWNADQMLKFVKENAPAIGTKVIAPESFQFRRNLSDPLLNDSIACANFDILGGHIYGGGLSSYPLAESKGKEIWMTEHLILETDWESSLSTGKDMNDCMTAGMSAYIWWYIVRFYGPIYDDDYRRPAGTAKGQVSKRGFVMSNYSRFIRPGYYRVEADSSPQSDVFVTAYKSDSTIVIVALNMSSEDKTQTFQLQNGNVSYFTPYITSETKNCTQETEIDVSGNSITAVLEPLSITTFVSSVYTTSVNTGSAKPGSFKLYQNYPNPFNPETTISFYVSNSSYVTLKVFDVVGREIETLVDGIKSPGYYNMNFDAFRLSSGIYFYQLRAGNYIETKKLVLQK
ncbi:MAG: T9SS type A sorting domain-containing protein [Melioribacteraceae bacterium]|nr:T9SS type A sorting domain-containing protein [Melioribacteraceae bacterium]